MRQMMKILSVGLLGCFMLLLPFDESEGAREYDGLCAAVKMEIAQELALERIGFLATLRITNNEVDASITDFSARLTFENPSLSESDSANDSSDLFFVQPPEIVGGTDIDGTGIIHPGETAVITWFIIPEISAGGTFQDGIRYLIGAELGGAIYGNRIAPEILAVLPDNIWVRPEPQLDITYFQPRDVDGDDPFTTDVVETPVPFTLGVLVKNVGHGQANKVRVVSEQPRIKENILNALIIPQLIGARIDDQPTDPSLTLYMGSIAPGKCRKGAWSMITSLSGLFVEFNATYTHASELGGRATSIIQDLNAYFMVHEVLNDQPGRDDLLDFLADTIDDGELIPDRLYESDCTEVPVNRLNDVAVLDYRNLTAQVRAAADMGNWVFIRLDDPAQAKYDINSVVRSDGKVLNAHNYWTHIRYRESDNEKLTYLNIFDFVSVGTYEYTVRYKMPADDTKAPVTGLRFSGQVQELGGKYFVLPGTQMYFTVEDASPVGTFMKLPSDIDFVPAYPFSISDPGEYFLTFYSRDEADNAEIQKFAVIVVSDAYPEIAGLELDSEELFIAGDTISVRPTSVRLTFEGVTTTAGLHGEVDIYQGVYGYPTVRLVPSSPTTASDAILTVGGGNVDYYQYRLNSAPWSAETAVANPIVIDSLSGTVQVSIKGRSQYGDYHSDDETVTVAWVVDPAASDFTITGIPETPSRDNAAILNISGSDPYCYRLDGGPYQPGATAGAPITLAQLTDGEHTVEVLARGSAAEACPGDVAGTTARWTVDRSYGLAFPEEKRVRHVDLGSLAPEFIDYTWDGKDDGGVAVSPGWYVIKLSIIDGLNRATSAIKLVRIGGLVEDGLLLTDAGDGSQKEACAFGRWVVWQEQRDDNWDIFAMDLMTESAAPILVRDDDLNQERPRTDGTYVVWEDRQADGTWDIWAKNLNNAEPAFAVTQTPDADDRKPVVYWPWIVYQTKPVADPTADWQLKAYNAVDDNFEMVDPTIFDQRDPWIYKQQVVWQDFRDAGPGEIYFKDLRNGTIRRVTNNGGGQYTPVIYKQWIIWADNRNGQFDLYGYNLLRHSEIQLTDTPEDETGPRINGNWVVYSEDSGGELITNLRMLFLSNFSSIQITNIASEKENPSAASGKLVWTESRIGYKKIMVGDLPDLHPVYNNQNTVAVTEGLVSRIQDAFTLLDLWNRAAGVTVITRYSSLVPEVVSESATWTNGQPSGTNFNLATGDFLWVRFDQGHILDLGQGACGAIDLIAGVNVLSYTCFPDHYTAYKLINEININNVAGLRMLDSHTGKWRVVSTVNGRIAGENFTIPRIAVIMLDLKNQVSAWKPGG